MKKKKLTYNSLAFSNLKNRKKQYILMIIAIILSTIFSSSIIYFAFSAYSSIVEKSHLNLGKQDCIMINADKEILNDAIEKDFIDKIGYGHILGFAYVEEENKIDGTSVAYLENEAVPLANPVIIEGSYPQKTGEIAIEQSALMRLGLNAKIGDTITLKFAPQNSEKTLDKVIEKDYILCGVLANKRENLLGDVVGYASNTLLPAAFVHESETIETGGKEALISYYTFNPEIDSEIIYDYFATENRIYTKNIDLCYTSMSGTYPSLMTLSNAYYMLPETHGFIVSLIYIFIVVVILLFASAVGIVNAFTTNLKERKKQIGMYRAVGATKKQIIKLFGRETIILSLICIPVSLLISFLLVKIILPFVDKDAILKPNILVLLCCGVFSFICIIFASLIPLISASKISPMQSIRKIDTTRKIKNSKIKTKKNFVTPDLIAKRNITISKGKQIFVSIFLVISIIFSCYLFSYLDYEKNRTYESSYDYTLNISSERVYSGINPLDNNTGFTENQKNEILQKEYIGTAYGMKKINANIVVDKMTDYLKTYNCDMYTNSFSTLTDLEEDLKNRTFFNELNDYSKEIKRGANYDEFFHSNIIALDEDYLKAYEERVCDGKIDIDKLNSGEEVILLAPENAYLYLSYADEFDDYSNAGFSVFETPVEYMESDYIISEKRTLKAGDTIDISVLTTESEADLYNFTYDEKISETRKTVKIGAIIDFFSDDEHLLHSFPQIYVITTIEGLNNFAKNVRYKDLLFNLNKTCTDEIDEDITKTLEAIEIAVADSNYISYYGFNKEQQEMYNNFSLIVLAIVILIFTICSSIINNTLTANIRNDKKKIGTMRAVGADNKVIFACYIKQLLSMFKWGYILGFGGFLVSYFVYYLYVKSNDNDLYMVFSPWFTIIIGFVVFIFCALNLWFKIKKETKNSIVENIREL